MGHSNIINKERITPQTWVDRESRRVWLPWIFIHDTNKVEGGLLVLLFDLYFSIAFPPPWKFFCLRPWPQKRLEYMKAIKG